MIAQLFYRLQYVNYLIKTKQTGTPKQLAKKLGISVRCWYKLRDELVNDLQVPITYCPKRKTYFFEKDGNMEFGFRKLTADDSTKINGGFINFLPYCILDAVQINKFERLNIL